MRDRQWRRYRNYVFLIPLFAVALFHQIAYSVVDFHLATHDTEISESPFSTGDGTIRAVNEQAAKAGLHPGDRILTIDGRDLKNERVLYHEIRRHKPNESLVLTVIPKGKSTPETIRVPVPANSITPITASDLVVSSVLIAMELFCVIIGIYVAAVLPNDSRALIVFGLMISLSQIVRSAAWYHFPELLWTFADAWYIAALMSWSIWLIAFGLSFPERFEWDVKRPWVKWLFLGPLIGWISLIIVDAVSAQFDYQAFHGLNRIIDIPILNGSLIIAAGVSFFFASLFTKFGTTKNRDARRRLRILLAGSWIGLTPLGSLILYQALGKTNEFNQVSQPIVIAICLLFCLFPLTLAYVIVVERAMDLRMVIRQGVRYTLARGGLRVLLSLAGAGIIFGLNVLVFGSRMSLTGKIGTIAIAVIALSLLIRRTRKRLLVWIDRKYFREAYNAQVILEDLSESVRSMVDEQQLLDTVARRISESLHVPQVAILLNGEGVYRPVYCLGFEPPKQLALSEGSKTVDVIKDSKEPARIYFDREDNWVHETPETELLTLKAIHAQLLLPVGLKDKLLGIFSLGPKLSEEPYSPSDVQLLRSVALQTGLALENSRLTTAMAKEMAQRERLNREIEIAHEVQERLFPQRLPVIAGIDYSGACRPALGVGGDYYDFLTLANGDLGIAIGDVSGKGIAAALLMASLQASLRGQAMMGQGDLARLMTNVSQLVFDATPTNRYATFFYGQYNRDSRVFTYVNAGHNPPMVLRRTTDGTIHVIRLETGGTVVGLFPNTPYQQASLVMEPGDIFVGFTDGISEAMNNEDEEWGEERLIPAVESNANRSAAEMIPSLMAEADRFVSGAPQHDDMTLVVVKLCV